MADENVNMENIASEQSGDVVVSHKDSITLEILQVLKEAQSQHGLKHSDYQRYRAYCARRIKRLRKSLQFVQAAGGRGKATFQRKDVTNQLIMDASKSKKDPLRYLYVTLMCAERCWAHAMALKQEANTEHRKRFHLVRKLKKSVLYAKALYALVNEEPTKCDARTKLESQAYFFYLSGIYFFETEKWRKASNLLKKAQAIYGKLCEAIVDDETLQLYKQRVDELKLTLRFCAFNLGDDQEKKAFLTNLKGETRSDDDYLATKLDELILQTREKQAVTLSEVSWLGKSIAVKNEKIRAFLMAVQDESKNLSFNQKEKLLFECRDCVQLLRDGSQEKSPLYYYLLYLRNELTCERNLALIASLENKMEGIRLYEVIISSISETKALPLLQHFSNDEEIEMLMKKLDAKALAYKALRCYNIGLAGEAAKLTAKQSMALMHRASEYAALGVDNDFMDDDLKKQLTDLRAKADGIKFMLYAKSLIATPDEEQPAGSAKSGPSKGKGKKRDDKRLAGAEGASSLVSFPPDFKPCKPLFFDLALNHIDMPPLEEEMTAKASGLTGFVKGFLGWKK